MSRIVTNAFAVTVLLTSLAVLQASEAKVADSPHSAVVVVQGAHSREGVGEFKAISVLNKDDIARLEAFFPAYQTQPTSSAAGGWEAGYDVYFSFRNGRTLKVTVSRNGGGEFWAMGDGDFRTRGDFPAFVKELVKKAK